MFEVKTMSGSRVRAKMAGTESTANTMSVISRKSRAMKSGRGVAAPVHAHEELLRVHLRGHGHEAAEEPDEGVLLRLHAVLLGEHHADAREDEEGPEEPEHPLVLDAARRPWR